MNKTIIIAEAGVNHNGSVDLALDMVDCAADCGADMIKFQNYIPEQLVSKSAAMASYQMNNTGTRESQLSMIRRLQLPFDAYKRIQARCVEKKIGFLSTPFDCDSIEFLNELGINLWKIPSGAITDLPYLIHIAQIPKPVLLSTGMSTLDEVAAAIDVLSKYGIGDITLLHCTTEYPAPYEDINLKAMIAMGAYFKMPVGYSDHTKGIEVAIAAAAMGAVVIEKHFTLDQSLPGPDHQASIDLNELNALVRAVHHVEASLGTGEKAAAPSEIKNVNLVRKSIVAKRNIAAGDVFSPENVTTKRPGDGISPMRWFEVLGQKAKRDFQEDELIEV